jgi:hypothetical protein
MEVKILWEDPIRKKWGEEDGRHGHGLLKSIIIKTFVE